MREVCNVGYGRHCCEQFPTSAAADAIRFHVIKDAGERINVQYIFEKECWPGTHGNFEFAFGDGLAPMAGDAILRRQAEAYIESYLRRRSSR